MKKTRLQFFCFSFWIFHDFTSILDLQKWWKSVYSFWRFSIFHEKGHFGSSKALRGVPRASFWGPQGAILGSPWRHLGEILSNFWGKFWKNAINLAWKNAVTEFAKPLFESGFPRAWPAKTTFRKWFPRASQGHGLQKPLSENGFPGIPRDMACKNHFSKVVSQGHGLERLPVDLPL